MPKVKLEVTLNVMVMDTIPQDVFEEYTSIPHEERVEKTAEMLKEELGADSVEITSYNYTVVENRD